MKRDRVDGMTQSPGSDRFNPREADDKDGDGCVGSESSGSWASRREKGVDSVVRALDREVQESGWVEERDGRTEGGERRGKED